MKYFSCAGLELGSKNYLWPSEPLCFMLRGGVHFIHFACLLSLCVHHFWIKLSASAKCGCPHQSPAPPLHAGQEHQLSSKNTLAGQSISLCSFCVSHSSYHSTSIIAFLCMVYLIFGFIFEARGQIAVEKQMKNVLGNYTPIFVLIFAILLKIESNRL